MSEIIYDGPEATVIRTVTPNGETLEVRAKPGSPAANEQLQRQRALNAIAGLRQIKGTTGTLTGAQLSNAVRLLATVALVLVRKAYDKHDEDD